MAGSSLNLKYDVTVRQQPLHARISAMKISDRRPVDPPIIVQLTIRGMDPQNPLSIVSSARALDRTAQRPHLTNPYYFMYAALVTPNGDADIKCEGGKPSTSGALVSSVRVLKDHPNSEDDAAFFIFPDICVRLEGSWRFKLSLFVIECDYVKLCATTYTQPFFVYPGKLYPGVQVSTPLTRALAAQGVKLRIRKEVRTADKGAVSVSPPPTTASTPLGLSLPKNELNSSPVQRAFGHVPEQGGHYANDLEMGRSPPKRRKTLTMVGSSGPSSPVEMRPPMHLPGSFDGFGLGLSTPTPTPTPTQQQQQHYRRSSHGSVQPTYHTSTASIPFGSLPSRLPPVQTPLWNGRVALPQSFDFTVRAPFRGDSDFEVEREERDQTGDGGWQGQRRLMRPSHPPPETTSNANNHNHAPNSGLLLYAPNNATPTTGTMPADSVPLSLSLYQPSGSSSTGIESEDDLELELDTAGSVGADSGTSGSSSQGYTWSSSPGGREAEAASAPTPTPALPQIIANHFATPPGPARFWPLPRNVSGGGGSSTGTDPFFGTVPGAADPGVGVGVGVGVRSEWAAGRHLPASVFGAQTAF